MRLFFILLILFVLLSQNSFCQDMELIKGIVVDSATFNPLQYVNVQIKNSVRGTSSDIKGNFSILANGDDTLLFSFIGHKTIELSLWDWEPGLVLMAEQATILKSITVLETALGDSYEFMFEEENNQLRKSTKKLHFYYTKGKKEKIKIQRFENENFRVKTYVDIIINNQEVKNDLMKKYRLTELEYYTVLLQFNEKNSKIMYFLTGAELLSMLNRFYEEEVRKK